MAGAIEKKTMGDLFKEKADNWDARPLAQVLSEGIGSVLLDNIALTPEHQVMDFGAGTGLICAHVAPKVKRVVAVDISPAMLDQLAQKEALQGKVETVCQDILNQPLADKFDLIISAMAMHHVEDTDALLKTFADHLVSGGQITLADLDQEDETFHPEDVEGVFHHGFDREALGHQLEKAGFSDIQFVTALTVGRNSQHFPVFLVTARKQ